MKYTFSKDNKLAISKLFGSEFMQQIEKMIAPVTRKWEIERLSLIESFSASVVFEGDSPVYGPIILKFVKSREAFQYEVEALQLFRNKPTCQVLQADYDNNIMLLEAIRPGSTLRSENDVQKRLDVFCTLFKKLHNNDTDMEHIDQSRNSYSDWIVGITDYMSKQTEWAEVAAHMKQAQALYVALTKKYSKTRLLHGDFHYYNILKSPVGYKIIDPKGVIGDPVFDIPRYILNEFWDEKDKKLVDGLMERVISYLSSELGIPIPVLGQLLYIEGSMAMCWCVEDGLGVEEKGNVLRMLDRLYSYIPTCS